MKRSANSSSLLSTFAAFALCVISGLLTNCSVHHPVVGVFPGDPTDDGSAYEWLLAGLGGGAALAAVTDSTPGSTGSSAFGDPAANATLWFRADSLPVVPHGTPVSTWADSSGNAQHATNADPLAQPAYIGDGSGPNGQPGLRFAGPGADADSLNGTFGAATTTEKTLYAVIIDTGSTDACCTGIIYLTTGGRNGLAIVNAGGVRELAVDRHSSTLAYNFDVLNRPTIGTAVYGTGFTRLYLDGTNVRNNAATWGQSVSTFLVGSRGGSGRSFRGDIFEILVYPGVHSDAEREETHCYLSAKYGIAVGHAC